MSPVIRRRAPARPFVLLLAACSLTFSCLFAQTLPPPAAAESAASGQPRFLQLDHRSPADASDAALLRSKADAIAGEAAFFGYNLRAAGWTASEAVCPEFPGHLLFHYQRTSRDGAVSLFTALIPRSLSRGMDRVSVVPVLYRNATPFKSAYGSERSISVFNRVVPPDLAEKALQPEGPWLLMGLCYAELVGAESHALLRSGTDVSLALAPLPTLRVNEAAPTRQVIFTDRNAPGHYLVWVLTFSDKGRLLIATATKLSDYVAPLRNGKEPPTRLMPPGQEPPVKVLPPGKEPNIQPLPQ
ncbi:MAG TPA: hypothetical protein VHU89_12820 [Acidobacteriaceae bacterium]|jgi:hypothetical protein|nr:hypothetical protein [Acidobacteriaceae bacterium]